MDITTCPHCKLRVFAGADGICPSCRRPFDAAPEATPAQPPPDAFAPPADAPKRSGTQYIGPMLGSIVGIVVANVIRQGRFDSMTVVTTGAAIAGAVVVLLVVVAVTRRR
jgi:hypothetical protein